MQGCRRCVGRSLRSGFTLIEVVVALLIVTLTVLTLSSITQHSLTETGCAKRARVASLLAQQKMVELEMDKDLAETTGQSGEFENFPGYEWSYEAALEVVKKAEGQSMTPEEEKRRTLMKIRLTVTYPGPADERSTVVLWTHRLQEDKK